MLDSVNSILTLIGTVVGIVAALLAIFLVIRKRQLATPKLHLLIGRTDQMPEDVPKKYKKNPTSTVIFVPEKQTDHPFIAFLFYGLQNHSKQAIKNVRLMLEYKQQYLIDNQLLKTISQFEPTVIMPQHEPDTAYLLESRMETEDIKTIIDLREVSVFAGRAQVTYDVPIIRPGETILLYDFLLLKGLGADNFEGMGFGNGGFQNILAHLRKIKTLKDYFAVNVWTSAENQDRRNSKFTVARFSNGPELNEALKNFGMALWFGELPRGYYFSDRLSTWLLRKLNHIGRLSHSLFKHELGILTYAEVALIRTKKNQTFALETPEISRIQFFTTLTPNCNYYDLPNYVKDFKTLMEWMGFPPRFSKSKKKESDYGNPPNAKEATTVIEKEDSKK